DRRDSFGLPWLLRTPWPGRGNPLGATLFLLLLHMRFSFLGPGPVLRAWPLYLPSARFPAAPDMAAKLSGWPPDRAYIGAGRRSPGRRRRSWGLEQRPRRIPDGRAATT